MTRDEHRIQRIITTKIQLVMAVYIQSQYSRAETGGLSSEVSVGQAIAVHTFNPSTQKADRQISASSSLVYSVLKSSHPHGWLNHYVPHTMKVNKGTPLKN